MDIQERRVVGALMLLLGVSCLAAAVYTKQFDFLVELLKKGFP